MRRRMLRSLVAPALCTLSLIAGLNLLAPVLEAQPGFSAQIIRGLRRMGLVEISALRYHNFNATLGSGGFGIRENAGAMEVKDDGGAWAAIVAGAVAPVGATYITQTANATLTNEQALDALASGILRVDTAAGVLTSLTASAGISDNLSDETGSGLLVFGTLPAIVFPNTGVVLRDAGNDHTWTILTSQDFTANETLTVAPGDASRTITLSGDPTLVAGTMAITGGTLAQFAATTSAQFFGVIDDETGGTLVVGSAAPVFTTSIGLEAAGVLFTAADGVLTIAGVGTGFDENIILNFDDVDDTLGISSAGVLTIDFSSIDLVTTGNVLAPHAVEVVTVSKTTTAAESGETYTNTGDADGSVITLLNDPVIGVFWRFIAVEAQTITIAPSAGETIESSGATCGTSVTLTDGQSVTIEAATGGAGAQYHVIAGVGFTCNA